MDSGVANPKDRFWHRRSRRRRQPGKALHLRSQGDILRYLSAPHVAMTLDDNLRGCLDAALTAIGETVNVVAASVQFLSVLSIVSSALAIATLPSGIARLHADRFGLSMAPPPLELKLPPISLLWSMRLDADPWAARLRDRISDCLAPISASDKP